MASSFPVGGAAQASVGRRNQFAQLRLDDLAHRVARERIEEAPFVGYLVARELFAAERDEFGLQHCTFDIGPRGLDAGDGQHSHSEVGFGNAGTVGDTVFRVWASLYLPLLSFRPSAHSQLPVAVSSHS